jgi:hypothetical protein
MLHIALPNVQDLNLGNSKIENEGREDANGARQPNHHQVTPPKRAPHKQRRINRTGYRPGPVDRPKASQKLPSVHTLRVQEDRSTY